MPVPSNNKAFVRPWLQHYPPGVPAQIATDGYASLSESGFNVYPTEIEQVVSLHAGVLDYAAIGVPDEKSGEAVKLFVVKRDSALTEDDLARYCKNSFTGYKLPKYIEFRDDLPKTNVGKILRRERRG